MCAIATCLLGLNEKAIFTLQLVASRLFRKMIKDRKIHFSAWNFRAKYSLFVGEGILINLIGLLLILFGGLAVYLVSQERYRRLPRPEDVVLLPA